MVLYSKGKINGHKSNNRLCKSFQPKQITCSSCKLHCNKLNSHLCRFIQSKRTTTSRTLFKKQHIQIIDKKEEIDHYNTCQQLQITCFNQMEIIERWVSVDYFTCGYLRANISNDIILLHDYLCIVYNNLTKAIQLARVKTPPTTQNIKDIITLNTHLNNALNKTIDTIQKIFNNSKHFCIFIIENKHINEFTRSIIVDLWNFKSKRVLDVLPISAINYYFKDTYFQCGICFEDKLTETLCLFDKCFQSHHLFCVDCVGSFIHTCTSTNNLDVICPLCRQSIDKIFTNSNNIKPMVIHKF